jgi:signal transduction histidine kinase
LKSLDRLKTDLLSNVSHELKTPMVAVKGYTSLVLKGKAGPVTPLQKEYLGISLENLQKQLHLIDRLLDFSKLGNGNAFVQEPFDLLQVLEESVQLIRPKADEKEIEIESQAGPGPWMAIGGRVNVGQVFNNLLSNAVKFTPERGKITITFKKQKSGRIKITVADTGIGIPPEMQHKIFDRFYQVDSSNTRRYGGIGLGLAIAQDIVKRHGGEIKVVSAEGRGAQFAFSLRLEDSAGPSSAGARTRRNNENGNKRKRKVNLGCG